MTEARVAERVNGAADGPWALPAGWVWAKLGEATAINPATSLDDLSPRSEITFVPMAAVAEESGLIELTERRSLEAVAKGYVRFRQGDVIFAKITPCMENGKVAPVPVLDGGVAAGSTEFHVLRPRAVDQRFLWYWLVSRAFRGRAKRNMSGSAGQLWVPASYLRDAALPAPPVAEQRRIVARIDALFAEIAEGEAALTRARDGLDTFRRALLKAAVTGELTKDWRETNRPNESGHDLVARIRATRAGKEHVGRRGRRAGEVGPSRPMQAGTLPQGWAWAALGDLFVISTGSTPSRAEPSLWNGGIPWVSSGEVAFCRIKSTRETISPAGLGNPVTRLHPPGTVLLAMIGEGKTRGQCAILDVAAASNQNAAAIRVPATPIPPEFVYRCLEQRYLSSRRESQGGNQPALNAGKVAEMRIALPPLSETAEILRRVSDALAALDDTRAMLDAEAADAARLRQSVLKAAFEGRLAPQDPADEPASVMLARMKADRSEPAVARGRGRRKASGAAAERSHEDRGM